MKKRRTVGKRNRTKNTRFPDGIFCCPIPFPSSSFSPPGTLCCGGEDEEGGKKGGDKRKHKNLQTLNGIFVLFSFRLLFPSHTFSTSSSKTSGEGTEEGILRQEGTHRSVISLLFSNAAVVPPVSSFFCLLLARAIRKEGTDDRRERRQLTTSSYLYSLSTRLWKRKIGREKEIETGPAILKFRDLTEKNFSSPARFISFSPGTWSIFIGYVPGPTVLSLFFY